MEKQEKAKKKGGAKQKAVRQKKKHEGKYLLSNPFFYSYLMDGGYTESYGKKLMSLLGCVFSDIEETYRSHKAGRIVDPSFPAKSLMQFYKEYFFFGDREASPSNPLAHVVISDFIEPYTLVESRLALSLKYKKCFVCVRGLSGFVSSFTNKKVSRCSLLTLKDLRKVPHIDINPEYTFISSYDKFISFAHKFQHRLIEPAPPFKTFIPKKTV